MFVKHLQSRQTSERTIHLHLEKTYIYTLTIEEEVWKNEVWNENYVCETLTIEAEVRNGSYVCETLTIEEEVCNESYVCETLAV